MHMRLGSPRSLTACHSLHEISWHIRRQTFECFMQHAHALTQPLHATCNTALFSTVASKEEQPSCLGGDARAIWCMQAAEQGSVGR